MGYFPDLSYKSFSLGIQVDSKIGGLLASSTSQYGSETGVMKNSLFGRNAKLGGITYTITAASLTTMASSPKVFWPMALRPAVLTSAVMTYADAVKGGYLKPIPAYAYYENLNSGPAVSGTVYFRQLLGGSSPGCDRI